MRVRWEDVMVRAKGLGTHLIPRRGLEELARAPDLAALGRGLAELGVPALAEAAVTPGELELAARREAARRLQVLARWLGGRAPVLAVLFDDEDRRSVRAILRGATAGVPARSRLAGLIATPALPERALEELAERSTPREIAALLSVWRHPFGAALAAAAQSEHPDLTGIELALHRVWAERAVRGARRGGPALQAYVAEAIDLHNAEAALLLAGTEHELRHEELFLPGGRILTRSAFLAAATAGTTAAARDQLAPAFRGTGFQGLLRRAAAGDFERAVLETRIRHWHHRALLDPVGPAPVLEYLLRLRAQVLMLRSLIWATALEIPPAVRQTRLLESPWNPASR